MNFCNSTIDIWHFLNENIVSSLISATAFAFIGAGLLKWQENRQAKGEMINKMKQIIGTQIKDNLEMVERVSEAIKKGGVHYIPTPFRTSSLQVFIQSGLIDRIAPENAYGIIDLNDRINLINTCYSNLIDFSVGMESQTPQSAKIRKDLSDYLEKVLPLFKGDLMRVKNYLDGAE